MSLPRILLVQVRLPSDPMAAHELRCIERRLAGRSLDLNCVNAFDAEWPSSTVDDKAAVLLGGSGDFSVHDSRSRPWVTRLRKVLDRILDRNIPAFGLCFGHQLLGYHLGMEVRTEDAYAELGTTTVELTEAGKNDRLFGHLGQRFAVHTGHSDHVVAVPDEVELLAKNEQLLTQAFRLRSGRVYSTQFHPDLSGSEATERYLAYKDNLRAQKDASSSPFVVGADVSTSLLGEFCASFIDG